MYSRNNSDQQASERARLSTRRIAEQLSGPTRVSVRPIHHGPHDGLAAWTVVSDTRPSPPGAGCLAGEGWGTPRQLLGRSDSLHEDHHGKWSPQRVKGGTVTSRRVGTVPDVAAFALSLAWGSRASRWGKLQAPV